MATGEENKQDGVVAIELPAPAGWVKKFTPKRTGTPQRNDIVFISPTGEKIKNKRQLDQYLKTHSGGPAASEFDWGTGDTPRRSSRLGDKSKAVEGPATSQSPKKRRKKSSPKRSEERSSTEGEGEATDEKDADPEETKENADVDTKDAGDGEIIIEEDIPEKSNNEEVEMKVASEEPSVVETQTDPNAENLNANVEKSNDAKIEDSNEESSGKEIQDGKIDCAEPDVKIEESKEESCGKEIQDGKIDRADSAEPDVKIEESKEESSGNEIQDGKVDSAEAVLEGKDDFKEKPFENESVLQEPTTGGQGV